VQKVADLWKGGKKKSFALLREKKINSCSVEEGPRIRGSSVIQSTNGMVTMDLVKPESSQHHPVGVIYRYTHLRVPSQKRECKNSA